MIAVWACLGAGAAVSSAVTYAPVDAPGPSLTVPAAQLAASVRCTGDLRGSPREPVLLLPATGVNSDQNFGYNYEKAFRANGTPYCTSDQPGDLQSNLGDIQTRGEYVTYAIRAVHTLAGRRIAVLGHSQGGMVMRWSLRFWPDTRAMVEDVIGMAGSNHGTLSAIAPCATGCAPANAQQAAGSNFTNALNSGQETFAGIDYTAVSARTLTVGPGVTILKAKAKVIGDNVGEANETLAVNLSSPTGATITDGTAIGTIVNDD